MKILSMLKIVFYVPVFFSLIVLFAGGGEMFGSILTIVTIGFFSTLWNLFFIISNPKRALWVNALSLFITGLFLVLETQLDDWFTLRLVGITSFVSMCLDALSYLFIYLNDKWNKKFISNN